MHHHGDTGLREAALQTPGEVISLCLCGSRLPGHYGKKGFKEKGGSIDEKFGI
jgi:hypothetical protein